MTEHQLNSLFSALRNGDREAFHTLYEALSPPVYTVLLRLVGDRQSAEDLLQETFLRLYRQPPGPEVTHPRAWVFQVARNLAVDHLRARRDALPLEDGSLPVPQADLDLGLDVESALNKLSPEDRLLVSLHLNGGLRFRECARLLGIPLGTALRRYHTAIGRVRDYLNG